MAKQKLTFTPSEHIKGKFEIINTSVPVYRHKTVGLVDFRTLTADVAQKLVDAGSMYIRKVAKGSGKKAGL